MTSYVDAVRSLHAGESGTLVRSDLFGLLADEVEWQVAGSPDRLPWAGTVRGPEGVRSWLERLNEHMEYERFELVEIYGDRDTVVELVNASGRAAVSRRPFESELVRIWTFQAGKAKLVRSYYDTAAYERSFLG
jgi:ketosteroid isomerase-like protein